MGRKRNNLRKRPARGWPQHGRKVWLGENENGVTEEETWPRDLSGFLLTPGS